jgi:integrase
MGSIHKLTDSKGRTTGWQYRWRDPKQRKESFPRKSEAEQFGLKIEASLRDNTYIDPDRGKVTFADFATEWHQSATRSHNYMVARAATLRLHIFPVIGDMRIGDIGEADITKLVETLKAKGFVAGTVRSYTTLARTIFKAAVRRKVIPYSPCQETRVPKGAADKVRPMEPVQVSALSSNIHPRYRALVLLGASTGGRQGELFGLRIEDITWDRKSPSVHFKRQLVIERGHGVIVRPLKNYEDRVVPVPVGLLDELARHYKDYPPSPEGYIFTTPTGKPINARAFRQHPWDRARKAAAEEFAVGSEASNAPEEAVQNAVRAKQLLGVTMHQLRDYYASLLIERGISVSVVSERLGHANQSTTLKHYAHLWVGHQDATRDVIGENLRLLVPAAPLVRPKEIN